MGAASRSSTRVEGVCWLYLFAFCFLTMVGVTFVRLEITSDLRGGYDNKIGWYLLFMVF